MAERKLKSLSTIRAKHFSVSLDAVQLPSGRITERIRVHHPDASAIVAFVDSDRIIMVRQYRYSIHRSTLEIPAGKIDEDESPEECVIREFTEETGYSVGNIEFLMKYVPAIGYSSEILYIFKGTNVKPIDSYENQTDEISKVEIISLKEIKNLISSGKIVDGKTIVAIARICDCW